MSDGILSVGADATPMIRDVRAAYARLQRDISNKGFSVNLSGAGKSLNGLTQQSERLAKSLTRSSEIFLSISSVSAIIYGTQRALSSLVKSTREVGLAFAEIQSILKASSSNFQNFQKDIFQVANQTGTAFSKAAEVANEFARQGLSLNQTLVRTKDALTLVRLAGVSTADAVSSLTAIVNTFGKEALTSTQAVERLASVSAAYAVSENDLTVALQRTGAAAADSGADFNQLISVITALQEKTARGGAVIGNGLKAIFTRTQKSETLDLLESLGVKVRDLGGETKPVLEILQDLAGKFQGLNSAQKSSVTAATAGIYQINTLQALLSDLSSEYSTYQGALEKAATSTGQAEARTSTLLETLDSLFVRTNNNLQNFNSTAGALTIEPVVRNILTGVNDIFLAFDRFKDTGIGDILLKGIGEFVSGPALVLLGGALFKITKSLSVGFKGAIKDIGILGGYTDKYAITQGQVEMILKSQDKTHQRILLSAKTEEQQALAILRIRQLITQEGIEQAALFSISAKNVNRVAAGKPVRARAEGFIPAVSNAILQESLMIKKGVGGASSSANPVVVKDFNSGRGRETIVANSDEVIVKNFNGSGADAIFNKNMLKNIGGLDNLKFLGNVSKIAAGGSIPNAAKGTSLLGPKGFVKFSKENAEVAKNLKEYAAANKEAAKSLRDQQKKALSIRKKSEAINAKLVQKYPPDSVVTKKKNLKPEQRQILLEEKKVQDALLKQSKKQEKTIASKLERISKEQAITGPILAKQTRLENQQRANIEKKYLTSRSNRVDTPKGKPLSMVRGTPEYDKRVQAVLQKRVQIKEDKQLLAQYTQQERDSKRKNLIRQQAKIAAGTALPAQAPLSERDQIRKSLDDRDRKAQLTNEIQRERAAQAKKARVGTPEYQRRLSETIARRTQINETRATARAQDAQERKSFASRQKYQSKQTGAFAASFAIPILAQNFKGKDDKTNQAIDTGANSLGAAAAIFATFPNHIGAIAAAVVGLGGAAKSLIDYNATIGQTAAQSKKDGEEIVNKNNEIANSISHYLNLQGQLKDSIDSGANKESIKALEGQLSEALFEISNSSIRNSLVEASSESDSEIRSSKNKKILEGVSRPNSQFSAEKLFENQIRELDAERLTRTEKFGRLFSKDDGNLSGIANDGNLETLTSYLLKAVGSSGVEPDESKIDSFLKGNVTSENFLESLNLTKTIGVLSEFSGALELSSESLTNYLAIQLKNIAIDSRRFKAEQAVQKAIVVSRDDLKKFSKTISLTSDFTSENKLNNQKFKEGISQYGANKGVSQVADAYSDFSSQNSSLDNQVVFDTSKLKTELLSKLSETLFEGKKSQEEAGEITKQVILGFDQLNKGNIGISDFLKTVKDVAGKDFDPKLLIDVQNLGQSFDLSKKDAAAKLAGENSRRKTSNEVSLFGGIEASKDQDPLQAGNALFSERLKAAKFFEQKVPKEKTKLEDYNKKAFEVRKGLSEASINDFNEGYSNGVSPLILDSQSSSILEDFSKSLVAGDSANNETKAKDAKTKILGLFPNNDSVVRDQTSILQSKLTDAFTENLDQYSQSLDPKISQNGSFQKELGKIKTALASGANLGSLNLDSLSKFSGKTPESKGAFSGLNSRFQKLKEQSLLVSKSEDGDSLSDIAQSQVSIKSGLTELLKTIDISLANSNNSDSLSGIKTNTSDAVTELKLITAGFSNLDSKFATFSAQQASLEAELKRIISNSNKEKSEQFSKEVAFLEDKVERSVSERDHKAPYYDAVFNTKTMIRTASSSRIKELQRSIDEDSKRLGILKFEKDRIDNPVTTSSPNPISEGSADPKGPNPSPEAISPMEKIEKGLDLNKKISEVEGSPPPPSPEPNPEPTPKAVKVMESSIFPIEKVFKSGLSLIKKISKDETPLKTALEFTGLKNSDEMEASKRGFDKKIREGNQERFEELISGSNTLFAKTAKTKFGRKRLKEAESIARFMADTVSNGRYSDVESAEYFRGQSNKAYRSKPDSKNSSTNLSRKIRNLEDQIPYHKTMENVRGFTEKGPFKPFSKLAHSIFSPSYLAPSETVEGSQKEIARIKKEIETLKVYKDNALQYEKERRDSSSQSPEEIRISKQKLMDQMQESVQRSFVSNQVLSDQGQISSYSYATTPSSVRPLYKNGLVGPTNREEDSRNTGERVRKILEERSYLRYKILSKLDVRPKTVVNQDGTEPNPSDLKGGPKVDYNNYSAQSHSTTPMYSPQGLIGPTIQNAKRQTAEEEKQQTEKERQQAEEKRQKEYKNSQRQILSEYDRIHSDPFQDPSKEDGFKTVPKQGISDPVDAFSKASDLQAEKAAARKKLEQQVAAQKLVRDAANQKNQKKANEAESKRNGLAEASATETRLFGVGGFEAAFNKAAGKMPESVFTPPSPVSQSSTAPKLASGKSADPSIPSQGGSTNQTEVSLKSGNPLEIKVSINNEDKTPEIDKVVADTLNAEFGNFKDILSESIQRSFDEFARSNNLGKSVVF